MGREVFIDLCKRMIVEYYNRYLKYDKEPIDKDCIDVDIYEIDPEEQSATLSTKQNEYLKYRITYNIRLEKITSYAYYKY